MKLTRLRDWFCANAKPPHAGKNLRDARPSFIARQQVALAGAPGAGRRLDAACQTAKPAHFPRRSLTRKGISTSEAVHRICVLQGKIT